MIVGGLRALRQNDLKLLLAYGTVSQLGFMIVLFGWGTPTAAIAGCVMLLAHGAFKAAAFMVVGIVDHQHGTRDSAPLPAPGRELAADVVRRRRRRRHRWPACRCCSGSSPRRPTSPPSSTRAPAPTLALAGDRRRLRR